MCILWETALSDIHVPKCDTWKRDVLMGHLPSDHDAILSYMTNDASSCSLSIVIITTLSLTPFGLEINQYSTDADRWSLIKISTLGYIYKCVCA